MPMGAKIKDEIREKVIAMHNAEESAGAIAKALGIGKTTACSIINDYKENYPDEYDQIRTQKKIQHIEGAGKALDGLLGILERRVNTIRDKEDVLDEIIDVIDDGDLSPQKKSALIGKMQTLLSPKLTELTTAFGTIYDKLERMKGSAADDEEDIGVIEIGEIKPLKAPKLVEKGD